MNRPFGWDLPPGVSLSDPGGPHDPVAMAHEAATEALWDAFYQATRAGLTIADINQAWAEAAEDAEYDDQADEARYAQMGQDEDPPQSDGPPYTDAVDDEDGMSELRSELHEPDERNP